MRGTYEGHIVAVFKRVPFIRNFPNGGSKEVPETWLLLLAQGFDSSPARVQLSEAQAKELNNPALQFEGIRVTGETVKDPGGFGQLVACASYEPLTAASA